MGKRSVQAKRRRRLITTKRMLRRLECSKITPTFTSSVELILLLTGTRVLLEDTPWLRPSTTGPVRAMMHLFGLRSQERERNKHPVFMMYYMNMLFVSRIVAVNKLRIANT